jgi:hypothetical protein
MEERANVFRADSLQNGERAHTATAANAAVEDDNTVHHSDHAIRACQTGPLPGDLRQQSGADL